MWYLLFNGNSGSAINPFRVVSIRTGVHTLPLADCNFTKNFSLPYCWYHYSGWWSLDNASIVSEYIDYEGRVVKTTGLGATISQATATGNFPLLLAATAVMSLVVLTNRIVWRPLSRLAQENYQLLV